jgi:2-keto-3-deoxy-L-rhamnonate aldolase RhmA
MKTNRLRELLRAGKPTLGTRMIIPWPRVVEVIGVTGIFDYIEFTAVNSSWDFELLENLSRAFELFPNMVSTIKVEPQEREFLVPRAVDAGFQNVKFAEVSSAEEVRECMRLVRLATPEAGGTLGWPGFRRVPQMLGSRVEDQLLGGSVDRWMKVIEDIGVFVVIEKKAALDNLDEILSIEGIDMVSVGGNDLALSMGLAGRAGHPEWEEVERSVARKCLERGIPFRVHLRGDFEEAERWIDMGIRNFFICADLQSIRDECRHQGGGLRKLLEAL